MHCMSLSCRNRQHLHTLEKWTVAERKLQMYCEALKKSDDKPEGRPFFDEYLCCWVIMRALLFICTLCFNEYKGMQVSYLGTYFHYN